MNNAEALSTTHKHKNLKKHTHTLPILIYCTIGQPCVIYRQNKTVSLVCFIALPEYRNIFKNMLLVDWCYNAKPSTQIKHHALSQTDQSTTWGGKNVAAMAKFQSVWGNISPSDHFTL